ncbi:putative galacturonosyltransferase 9 [Acorus gramineus]|uniref:Hexosyltransferase n=1 Tax=Acorus gramineus TaxID=55184 RepID=A0AAV9AQI5_ACOGR|nr:putative galacturonosyltransferase 9 [Acorus gramineus]
MAGGGGIRIGRSIGERNGIRPSRIIISAVFLLLFLVSLFSIFSSNSSSSTTDTGSSSSSSTSHTFLALNSDPSKTRQSLIHKQATDHIALANAYASYGRRLKLDASRQLRLFESLASSLSDSLSRHQFDPDRPIEEEPLRQLEKEAKDKIKATRLHVSESKESYDTQIKIQKLHDTIFTVSEQLARARKLGDLSIRIAAKSTPKSLNCLAMRLMGDRIAHPEEYADLDEARATGGRRFDDPGSFHYAVFSDNVIAVSTVVNSVVKNAREPARVVFHIVTDEMNLQAMEVWFKRRPLGGGARVEIRSVGDFDFLNSSYVPAMRRAGDSSLASVLRFLRFYLPEMYPKLQRIVLLEDDVVVQRDLSELWRVDLDGKVNGAVETCFGPFRRFSKYLNFSDSAVAERYNAKACAWAYGVNVFDLDAWRSEGCTDLYHHWDRLNEDGTLWRVDDPLPAGLVTFYGLTKPLDKTWHVMGLGYNPSIGQDEIKKAVVVHFDGEMKPWLDIAMNQYKHLWTKYVDTEMEYLPLCNFGV